MTSPSSRLFAQTFCRRCIGDAFTVREAASPVRMAQRVIIPSVDAQVDLVIRRDRHGLQLGAMITSNSGWAGMMVLVVVIADAPQIVNPGS